MLSDKHEPEGNLPSGSKGEKHPAGAISNAVHVMRATIGEMEKDVGEDDDKDPAHKALDRKGGKAGG